MSDEGGKNLFPFDPASFGKIKLGAGVVGKVGSLISYSVVGTLLLALVFVFTGYPAYGAGFGLFSLLLAVGGALKMFDFAQKHPEIAILEGSEFVRLEEMRQSAREKSMIVIDAEPVANTAPPLSIASKSPDGV